MSDQAAPAAGPGDAPVEEVEFTLQTLEPMLGYEA